MKTNTELIYIQGEGNANAKIAVVGEAPGKHEEEMRAPFSGPTGKLLDDSLKGIGLTRKDIWLTNVFKYRIFSDYKAIQDRPETQQQIKDLWEELEAINPKVIISLGNTALQVLTGRSGIRNWRGSVLQAQRHRAWVIPTYNPAHILYQIQGEISAYWQKYVIDFDFTKASKVCDDPGWKPPSRLLHIAKSSLDFYRFLERNSHRDIVSVDIETYKCIPACVAFAFSPYEAISVPLFKKFGEFEVTTMPLEDLIECWRLTDKALRHNKVMGQNFKFDEERLEGIGFRVPNFYYDTMLAAHVISPELPKSQAFLTSLYTDEPYYKDEGKEFNPKKDKVDRWLLYNAKDAAVAYEIMLGELKDLEADGLTNFYFEFQHRLHEFYLDIERNGIAFDADKNQELRTKYETEESRILEELGKLAGFPINPNSPKQVKLWLETDLRLPVREDTSEETLVALRSNHAKTLDQKRALKLILDARKTHKTLSTYVYAKPDYDDRMRTSYRITGTETGRTSTSILKPPMRPEKIGLAFQTMTKHGDIGAELRSELVADDGYVFVEIDQSQAEARVVALLADDEETLKLFDTTDIHRVTANWIFNRPRLEDITNDERFIGKTTRHGGNYDMHKRRFMLEVNTMASKYGIDIEISEWKAGKILEIFHKFTPKIRGVFHATVKELLRDTRKLANPFGRVRTFYERWGDDLFREAYAQIPQSTVGDKTKVAGLKIVGELDVRVVIEAHDALTFLFPINEWERYAKRAQEVFEEPIDFTGCSISRRPLVIPAEIQIGERNLKELKKIKL